MRHRAKLVATRSRCKAEVHAVLAKAGIWVPMTDLFGVAGNQLLDDADLGGPYRARVASLRRLIEALDFEIELFTKIARGRLARDPDYRAVQQIPGIGPVLGAVFVAEIGDVHRFPGPEQLTSWAGLTPRHRESDTTVHRGRITKQGSRLVRWAAIESVKILPASTRIGAFRDDVAARRGSPNIGAVAAARRQLEFVYYALRDHQVRALQHQPTTTRVRREHPRRPGRRGSPPVLGGRARWRGSCRVRPRRAIDARSRPDRRHRGRSAAPRARARRSTRESRAGVAPADRSGSCPARRCRPG